MKKLILLILVGAFLLLSLIGCNVSKLPIETPESTIPEGTTPEGTTPEGTTPENTTPENTTPENTPQETTPPENSTTENTSQETTTPETTPQQTPPTNTVIPISNGENPFNNVETSFTAKVFAQLTIMSSRFSLEVEIDNGKIYLSDTLYECVGMIEKPTITYDRQLLLDLENDENAKSKLEVLEEIKNSEICYVLEPADVSNGKAFLLYEINGVYYFSDSIKGKPSRIWYEDKTIEPTPENPPVNNIVPVPDGEKPFGNVQTSFTARVFAQLTVMSSRFSLNIKIENDDIYLETALYRCVGIIKNPTITYSQPLLWDVEDDENAEEKLEILEKIKNSETCYVLQPVGTDTGKTIVLYYIDGVYYFSDSINGKPSRIWYAITDTPQ